MLSSAALSVYMDFQLHVQVHTAAYMLLDTSVASTAFSRNTKLPRAVKSRDDGKELQKDLRDWVTKQPSDGLSLIWINIK